MLVALAITNLLMPEALTLLDYHYLCPWLVRNINNTASGFGGLFVNSYVLVVCSLTSLRKRVFVFKLQSLKNDVILKIVCCFNL
jgi:hypothetical protein